MKIQLANNAAYSLSKLVPFKTRNDFANIRHLDLNREVQIDTSLTNKEAFTPDVIQKIEDEILSPIFMLKTEVFLSIHTKERHTILITRWNN